MAKKYALVPESWLQQQQQNIPRSLDNTPKQTPAPQVSISGNFESESNLKEIATLLPKNMQGRARMLLHYLENANVRVNELQRIVYSDCSIGSHIINLVRYAISPFMKSRPLDWPRFKELCESAGTPGSILANRNDSVLKNWKPY